MTELVEDQARWEALQRREHATGETFVYAVTTTGVYCRPGCPSRLAKRENVRFYASNEAAEQAGFRPCKRCQPTGMDIKAKQEDVVERVCRLLSDCEQMPSLAELADSQQMSAFHLHRLFKSITGVTPRAYFTEVRAQRARRELSQTRTVTEAIYNAGYGSGSRFYAESTERLGMTPTQLRNHAAKISVHFAVAPCSLGFVLVAATQRGICAILLGSDAEALQAELQTMFRNAEITPAPEDFRDSVQAVVSFVEVPQRGLRLPLDLQGTAFQQRVWEALRQIAPGTTMTYTEVAERIGNPKSVRAVAQACATNPAALVVPCHRVVGKSGSLTGYRWGLERKRVLLDRESEEVKCGTENTITLSK